MSEMRARTYARIDRGAVAELLSVTGDIRTMFHPELTWIDVTAEKSVRVGWLFDGHDFMAPPPATAVPAPTAPTIADLQA